MYLSTHWGRSLGTPAKAVRTSRTYWSSCLSVMLGCPLSASATTLWLSVPFLQPTLGHCSAAQRGPCA